MARGARRERVHAARPRPAPRRRPRTVLTEVPPLAPGTPRRLGPYLVDEEISRGGAARIFRAHHGESGAPVAVKVMAPVAGAGAAIEREIAMLSRIRHPGIVAILGHGTDGGRTWYAMELLHGTDLRSHARALGAAQGGVRVSMPALLALFCDLCQPLGFLHGEGIVHRDLHPGNVVVRDGHAILVDLGLSQRFAGGVHREEISMGGFFSGAVPYMAPEQIRGELCDARADLYALGCLLWEACSGRPPFAAATAAEVLRGHLETTPRLEHADVPRALGDLVRELLAKDPLDRPGSAEAVSSRLEELGARGAPASGPRAQPFLYRARLVGRERPLAELRRRLDEVDAGGGSLHLLTGPSGAGKTRLALELARDAAHRGISVVACSAEVGAAPFGLMRPLLRQMAARHADGTELPPHLLAELAPFEPALAALQQGPREPRIEADRLFRSLDAALGVPFRRGPLLVILDDIQWADPLSLALCAHWAEGTPRGILALATVRIEEAPAPVAALIAQAPHTRLDRLGRAEVDAMTGHMLGVRAPEPELCAYVAAESGGNPFFVAELLRSAVAGGLLTRDGRGRWRLEGGSGRQLGHLATPASILDVVRLRLVHLGATARTLVEVASVLGRTIDEPLLQELSGVDRERLLAGIGELLARQVLEESADGSLQFDHDQVRQAAYQGLPARRRSTLHRAAAGMLEERAGALQLGQATHDLLAAAAAHWERGGRRATAARRYAEAADTAESIAPLTSIAHYGDALRLLPPGPQHRGRRTDLALRLAELHYLAARYEEASTTYRQVIAQPDAERLPLHVARAWSGLGWVQEARGEFHAMLESVDRALALARGLGRTGRAELPLILFRKGWAHYRLGEAHPARVQGELALELAGQLGASRSAGLALNLLGNVELMVGAHDVSDRHYERGLAIFREVGDLAKAAVVLNNQAESLRVRGQHREAVLRCEEALRIARDLGDRTGEMTYLCTLGACRVACGDPAGAERELREAIALSEETGERYSLPYSCVYLGEALVDLHRVDEARAAALRALDPSRGTPQAEVVGGAWRVLGRVASASGKAIVVEDRPVDADACFQESVRVLEEAGLQPERTKSLEAWHAHRARPAG